MAGGPDGKRQLQEQEGGGVDDSFIAAVLLKSCNVSFGFCLILNFPLRSHRFFHANG